MSDDLALLIYKVTRDFPKAEMWGLTSQMRRAAISVPANIAEGAARNHKKEYLQFLYTAMVKSPQSIVHSPKSKKGMFNE